METINIYPKIRTLQKCQEIFHEHEVIITEKIHGKNMRIIIPENAKSENAVIIGAREYDETHPAFGLNKEAGVLRQIIDIEKLFMFFKDYSKKIVIFGEIYGLGVQKGILYSQCKGFLVFDICIGDKFVEYDRMESICNELNLELAPFLYRGKPIQEVFNKFIETESTLAKKHGIIKENNITEGIIIRSNPLKTNQYDEFIICKYKSSWAIEEKEEVKPKRDLSNLNDFVDTYVTENRVRKMIDKLKEKSMFSGTMRDVPNLGVEVTEDILKEETAGVNELFSKDKTLNEKTLRNKITSKTAVIYGSILNEK